MVFKVKEIQNVNWDVSDIVKKYESLEQLTGLVESKATVLKKFEGKIAQLDIGSFLTFMKDYGEYYELSVLHKCKKLMNNLASFLQNYLL